MLPIWVLFVLVCLLWLGYLVHPLRRAAADPRGRRERLVEEKLSYLQAINDAELDFRTGKIAESDFIRVRDRLEIKAAELLRSLDRLDGGSSDDKIRVELDRLRNGGHKVRRLLGWLLFALLVPGVSIGAVVSGRILNGSEAEGVVSDLDVHLTGTAGSGERIELATQSNDEGWFRFTDVPSDTSGIYVVSATFEGVEYASRVLRFTEGQSEIGTDLFVYTAAGSAEDIHILGHHYIFDAAVDVDSIMVTEVVALANHGSHAFVPAEPLVFLLPATADQVRALSGFETAEIVGHTLQFSSVLRPGHIEGVVRYLLPGRSPLEFASTITLPTDEVTILVSPVGSEVNGAGLEAMGVTELGGGIAYDRYRVPGMMPGASFAISIRIARPSGPNAWIIVGSLALVFVGLLSVRERSDRSAEKSMSPERRRLESERTRYLDEIIDLEGRSKAGPMPEAELQKERDRLLAKATALQEMIDRLREEPR